MVQAWIGDAKGSQEDNIQILIFVEAMVRDLRVFTLVDIGATHSVVRSKKTSSLHIFLEVSQARFKVVNSTKNSVT